MNYLVGFIGTGVMGSALARAVCQTAAPAGVLLANVPAEGAEKLSKELGCAWGDNLQVAAQCRYIYLAVKPQVMKSVLTQIAPVLKERTEPFVLVSMAAGLTIATLQDMLGFAAPVVRIMPNVAATVGKAVILCACNDRVSPQEQQEFLHLTQAAGLCDLVPEGLIDPAGSLTGCGPAFAFMAMQALADGAVACGVDRARAARYAAMTLLGAAQLALESGEHFEKLKDSVCSPAGSTIEGVKALESLGLRDALIQAVCASYRRNKELGNS